MFGWGGGGERWGGGEEEWESNRKKKKQEKKKKKNKHTHKKQTTGIRLFFELMLYIKFKVPGLSGSLVLTQTRNVEIPRKPGLPTAAAIKNGPGEIIRKMKKNYIHSSMRH